MEFVISLSAIGFFGTPMNTHRPKLFRRAVRDCAASELGMIHEQKESLDLDTFERMQNLISSLQRTELKKFAFYEMMESTYGSRSLFRRNKKEIIVGPKMATFHGCKTFPNNQGFHDSVACLDKLAYTLLLLDLDASIQNIQVQVRVKQITYSPRVYRDERKIPLRRETKFIAKLPCHVFQYPENKDFISREDTLKELELLLPAAGRERPKNFAIWGPPARGRHNLLSNLPVIINWHSSLFWWFLPIRKPKLSKVSPFLLV
ncbi:hypothetical protein FQN57_005732 [Myotisia sp. PD_48]|nr:hypothetical protein FQN57_005732 [Myotisia sp. PD_48]